MNIDIDNDGYYKLVDQLYDIGFILSTEEENFVLFKSKKYIIKLTKVEE